MRKIWSFFWYQNLEKFEKNLTQSDRAPLRLLREYLLIDGIMMLANLSWLAILLSSNAVAVWFKMCAYLWEH